MKTRFFRYSGTKFPYTEKIYKNYNFLLEKYPDALFFLDPPYFTQGSSYTDFSKEQLLQFLENIKNLDFIYKVTYEL